MVKMSPKKSSTPVEKAGSKEGNILEAYKECGEHMRFYSDARFKIMTLSLTLASLLISIQQLMPDVGLVFGFIGLTSALVFYSLEYRYNQAWVALLQWAERNVEDVVFGKGEGPLNSYRNVKHPWYILKSKPATDMLYYLLILIWTGDLAYYGIKTVVMLLK
jgi:hypothetical protein